MQSVISDIGQILIGLKFNLVETHKSKQEMDMAGMYE
jgi:hypothetical protein